MAPPLLNLRDIRLGYGGRPLLDGVSVTVHRGSRMCLVGRNGSGKSTLLKIAAGLLFPDSGDLFAQPGCRISYLAQEPDLAAFPTVSAYVAAGLPEDERHQDYRVAAILNTVNLDGAALPAQLSGGEARRAALARTLLGTPDILLLDEPTNHLDLPTIEWLERELAAFGGGLIVISHDRTFLTRITQTTLWLDRGQVRRLDEGFDAFEEWSERIMAEEEEAQAKLQKRISEETVWSRAGISARRRRNQGRLRRLMTMRAERANTLRAPGSVSLDIDSGPLSGKIVVEAENVSKRFDGQVILRGFSTRVARGERVGLIGPNGAGKSTLVKLLTGQLPADSGRVRLGTNLSIVYLDQARTDLTPTETPLSILCPGGGDQVIVRGQPRHVAGYLQDFLFDPRQLRMAVSSLSGGERNRLLLARALARPSNFLVLDEPTNDLDMDTLDLLQEMLADYEGTLLLVSHDRDFLDRTVTSTIVLEGDGTAVEYAGGYSDYLRQRVHPPVEAEPERAKGPSATRDVTRPASRQRKLSYQQQRALDELPQRMERLGEQIAVLEASLADPLLYQRDPNGFAAKAAALEEARTELANCEHDWLELELMREALAREL